MHVPPAVTAALASLPAPPEVRAPGDGIACLAIMATLGAAAFVTAALFAWRRRDVVPVLACLGAVLAVLNEPIYDLLGQIVYPSNHPRFFRAFDRDIPLFLIGGYVPWVGLLPSVLAARMRDGIRVAIERHGDLKVGRVDVTVGDVHMDEEDEG